MSGHFTLCVILALWALGMCLVSGQMCAPKLFEANKWTLQISHTDRGADILESMSAISMDSIGQRLASNETGTHNGQQYTVYRLYYYPAGTLFTVQNGACTVSPLKGNFSQLCFEWSGSHVIDGFVKEYIGTAEGGDHIMGAITYDQGVGSLYCLDAEVNFPVFTGTDGVVDGVPVYRINSYLNLTTGIKDPSVFTPPALCLQS